MTGTLFQDAIALHSKKCQSFIKQQLQHLAATYNAFYLIFWQNTLYTNLRSIKWYLGGVYPDVLFTTKAELLQLKPHPLICLRNVIIKKVRNQKTKPTYQF